MSFAHFQCCARHLQDPQFDPRLFGTFQEACVLLVKAAVPWGRPIYTANHNGGHELEFDAPLAKVVFLHFAGATIALNQVRSGQACPLMARPATGARAQRGKYLHNCYAHAANSTNESKCELHRMLPESEVRTPKR